MRYGNDQYIVQAGRRFDLPPRRADQSLKQWQDSPEYREVLRQADEFESQHLAVMSQQKGAPLTRREMIEGTHEAPPAPLTLGTPPTIDRSTINVARMQLDLKEQLGTLTPQRRRELEREAKQRDEEIAADVAQREATIPDSVKTARMSAAACRDLLRRDPRATPDEVRAADALCESIHGGMSADDYWSQHDELMANYESRKEAASANE